MVAYPFFAFDEKVLIGCSFLALLLQRITRLNCCGILCKPLLFYESALSYKL